MADYIDIDTPIDVAVYQRNRRIQVTLRQILDSNDAKYQTADVVPMDFHERCLQIEIQKRMALEKTDVRPVARGKWEAVMLDHERMGCRPTAHYCSECHQITWFRTFYCPNCGADMREES